MGSLGPLALVVTDVCDCYVYCGDGRTRQQVEDSLVKAMGHVAQLVEALGGGLVDHSSDGLALLLVKYATLANDEQLVGLIIRFTLGFQWCQLAMEQFRKRFQ